MKKFPSFKSFLLIMVFVLEGLSLAVVIGFLFATLDQSMQQEQVSRINVQKAELRLYLKDRLNYTYNRVKEIRFNNNIKISLLLGMQSKITDNMKTLYPGIMGSAFYIRNSEGQYTPEPEDDHTFLYNNDLLPLNTENYIHIAGNPHTFVYSIPIIHRNQIKGTAIGVYDPSKDPHFSEHTGTFNNISLGYRHKDHLINLFTHNEIVTPLDKITETLSRKQYRKTSKGHIALSIQMKEYPDLFLIVNNQPYRQKRFALMTKLIALCVPLLFLTFTFSFLILKSVTSSIESMAKNAYYIAQTDDHSDIDISNIKHAEFLRLAQAFNKVLSTIRQRTDDLENANQNLHQQMEQTNRLEKQLRQARKMEALGTLAGGIAHDFNNILYAIIGFCELALHDAAKKSSQQDNIEEAIIGARRATDLVKQILTFARQTDIEKHPLNLTSILKESLKFIRVTLPTSIEIHTRLDDNLTILADPTLMQQIVVNLCTNAGHAMRESGGVLEVTLETIYLDPDNNPCDRELNKGNYACLKVTDTGQGMPTEILERIFDPYYTTKPQGEGSGMGLSVVQGIVHSLNGGIRVDSTVNKGSSFHVFIPVLNKTEIEEITMQKYDSFGSDCREHILLVDDELTLTRMITQMLCQIGYQVTAYNNPVDALDQFIKTPEQYDLVISDVTMPHMTGTEMAGEMMKIRPELPILLCTGYNTETIEKEAESIGVLTLLNKPLSQQDLSTAIRKLLDR